MPHIGESGCDANNRKPFDYQHLRNRNPRQLGETCMNEDRTCATSDAKQTQPRSLRVLRREHAPTSAVGYHLSNMAELMKLPNPPAFQLKKQREGLQRALAAGEAA